MKKTFDCLEMKSQIQESLWSEAGGTLKGFKELLFNKKDNALFNQLFEKKKKSFQKVN